MTSGIDIEAAQKSAFLNVVSSINVSSLLPEQMFEGIWDSFHFFESDRIFSQNFVEIVQNLMHLEKSTCCCLLNLSRLDALKFDSAEAIFLGETTVTSEYHAKLRKGGPTEGWLFGMDRYGCASDRGGWCIYCEKENDVAIIALRSGESKKRFARPMEQLHVFSIAQIVDGGSPLPPPFNQLVRRWRAGLTEHYSTGVRGTMQN